MCRMNSRLKEIELNSDDTVKCFRMADGSTIEGDLYVSAMPGKLTASCLASMLFERIGPIAVLPCCTSQFGRFEVLQQRA